MKVTIINTKPTHNGLSLEQCDQISYMLQIVANKEAPQGIAHSAYFTLIEIKGDWLLEECYEQLQDLKRLEDSFNVDIPLSPI